MLNGYLYTFFVTVVHTFKELRNKQRVLHTTLFDLQNKVNVKNASLLLLI
jgi:hypothetical protein